MGAAAKLPSVKGVLGTKTHTGGLETEMAGADS